MREGYVAAVKRFEIHDGPGVRTTLFLKGCPLSCRWCHNPECISPFPELAYTEKKCIGCGECTSICNAHTFQEERHIYSRSLCKGCGRCSDVCLGEALKLYGRKVNAETIISELVEDQAFFGKTGGVTISGGEPLMQPEFTFEVLSALKGRGINTALDTCGFASEKVLNLIIPVTDVFLYDIKAIDEEVHIRATGKSNKIILNNIRLLNDRGCNIEVRIPFVKGYNDDQIYRIGSFLKEMPGVRTVKLLPYHDFAASKYLAIGRTANKIEQCSEKEIADAIECLLGFGLNVKDGRK